MPTTGFTYRAVVLSPPIVLINQLAVPTRFKIFASSVDETGMLLPGDSACIHALAREQHPRMRLTLQGATESDVIDLSVNERSRVSKRVRQWLPPDAVRLLCRAGRAV